MLRTYLPPPTFHLPTFYLSTSTYTSSSTSLFLLPSSFFLHHNTSHNSLPLSIHRSAQALRVQQSILHRILARSTSILDLTPHSIFANIPSSSSLGQLIQPQYRHCFLPSHTRTTTHFSAEASPLSASSPYLTQVLVSNTLLILIILILISTHNLSHLLWLLVKPCHHSTSHGFNFLLHQSHSLLRLLRLLTAAAKLLQSSQACCPTFSSHLHPSSSSHLSISLLSQHTHPNSSDSHKPNHHLIALLWLISIAL